MKFRRESVEQQKDLGMNIMVLSQIFSHLQKVLEMDFRLERWLRRKSMLKALAQGHMAPLLVEIHLRWQQLKRLRSEERRVGKEEGGRVWQTQRHKRRRR